MKNRISFLAIVLILFITQNIKAQGNDDLPKLRIYSSFSYNRPMQNMNKYEYGFGIYSNVDYNFNKHIAARLDIGWNDYSGPETTYIDQNGIVHTEHPNMSIWDFTAGLRAMAGPAYIEARGGYYTGVNSWGYVPAIGIVFWKLDLQASYNIVGDKEWLTIRLGYYF
jgi:hypothetical protein